MINRTLDVLSLDSLSSADSVILSLHATALLASKAKPAPLRLGYFYPPQATAFRK